MSSTIIQDERIKFFKGVGPNRARAMAANGLNTFDDLIHYFPRRYIDRSTIIPMDALQENQEVTVIGKVESAGIRRARRSYFYIVISDGKGMVEAVWFNAVKFYQTVFKIGEWVSLSGKLNYYRGYQFTHPDFDKLGEGEFDNLYNTARILPFYPGNELFRKLGINSQVFRKVMRQIFEHHPPVYEEPLPVSLRSRYNFPPLTDALKEVHLPQSEKQLARARERLIYEEFFYLQLLFALQHRHGGQQEAGIPFDKNSEKAVLYYKTLPFELTNAQKKVIREIRRDMKTAHPMNRLLQGDVGSGKTLVATMAILYCIDNGYQAAMMAPTEILAEQHYQNLRPVMDKLGIPLLLLTGSRRDKERREIQALLASGQPLLLIGTHALSQESVRMARLALVVIDEQHRFGVLQRGALIGKADVRPDVLVMTATPIPRTLAMTAYGSLDVSIINELPANRKPIRTVMRYDNQADKIYGFIRKQVEKGEQAYIVYPLVEESEKIDLKAASEGYAYLQNGPLKGLKLGLLHGRMKSVDKEAVMREFSSGKLQILISTTVIEVGVDVPSATIMLIEHAERFGLAQLHQLRGRVGRGGGQSYCILKTPYNVGDVARQRIQIMTRTNDGFIISEKDLELRGWGDFFGTQQSGLPEFKIAHPIRDVEWLEKAREDAFRLVDKDPQLRKPENNDLRCKILEEYHERLALFKIS